MIETTLESDQGGSELGRALAARRKPHAERCASCGIPFPAFGRGCYCSPTCRNHAAWLLRKAKIAARKQARQRKL